MWQSLKSNAGLVIILLLVMVLAFAGFSGSNLNHIATNMDNKDDSAWNPPSLYYDASEGEERKLLAYGQDLIANTSKYFGPKGLIAQSSNGMNCQNCHLNAGRKSWGNNYSMVNAEYPKFRHRSGAIETIYKRFSDCFERSLNGVPPDSNSTEFKAIERYIKWVGKDVKKGDPLRGRGIEKIPLLDRAADPEKGRVVYNSLCQKCHGADGQGKWKASKTGFEFPPLWGPNSYNTGAGLYRLGNLAGFVKNNMPFDEASHAKAVLTNEQAWDVAAFINSQPRPTKDLSKDWPDLSKKPFDHPFGPYTDSFSEAQHKYGPFKPIIARSGN